MAPRDPGGEEAPAVEGDGQALVVDEDEPSVRAVKLPQVLLVLVRVVQFQHR